MCKWIHIYSIQPPSQFTNSVCSQSFSLSLLRSHFVVVVVVLFFSSILRRLLFLENALTHSLTHSFTCTFAFYGIIFRIYRNVHQFEFLWRIPFFYEIKWMVCICVRTFIKNMACIMFERIKHTYYIIIFVFGISHVAFLSLLLLMFVNHFSFLLWFDFLSYCFFEPLWIFA